MKQMVSGGYIGSLLLGKGLISKEQLDEAVEEQKRTGKLIGHILVDLGFVSEEDIYLCLGTQLGMETVDLKKIEIPKEVLKYVNPSMARIYNIMPVAYDGTILTVAISDPLNPHIIDDLHFMLDIDIRAVLSNAEDIKAAIKKQYGEETESIADLIEEIEKELPKGIEKIEEVTDVDSLKELANEAPVVKLLNLVLAQAIKEQASDIHFEPFETEFKVRYRVDGVLYEMVPPPKHLSLAITSRIKVMANLDIAERRLPQDGRILVSIGGRYVDLRVSTLPTAYGESVVIRVLDRSVVSLELTHIGMSKTTLADFEKVLEKPHGIVIVTGPTGSGKTTTLYSGLKRLNTLDSKLITTEDPVEYDIEGIVQVNIREEIGLTFANSLRSILRQDPDIIMVGEIRDLETAEIAVQASLTGHLVFSTLHTNDAAGAIVRMIDMGVEPFLITSTLEAVLAQRLVRTICPNCKTAFAPTPEMLSRIGLTPAQVGDKRFHYGKGCKKCNNTGYKGRIGIFELLLITDPIRALIMDKAPSVVIYQKAVELGLKTLRDDGVEKVFEGLTTIEEISRET
ncbi:MAG TPA: type II secretion system ATPase GspE [bacterium]|nr:type II secretion system ATPase GspE [bacterium]